MTTKIDGTLFHVAKANLDWECKRCGSSIPRGSYCLGQSYTKICLTCSEDFLSSLLSGYLSETDKINKLKQKLGKNRNKYRTNNIVAALRYESRKR